MLGRLPAGSERLALAVGVAMRKRIACLFAVVLASVTLLGFLIQARSRASLRRDSPPTVVRAEKDARPAAKPVKGVGPEKSLGRFQQEGISIECTLTRIGGQERAGEAFVEGDDVRFRFRIADGSGTPLTSVFPAAWLLSRPAGSVTSPKMAIKKAQSMVNASVLTPAELDLNVYYVLTLNANGTIGVVDPLFGYGGTKLLAMIPLKSPGADWQLSTDEFTVFVSLPESNEVAVVDTAKWEVRKYVPGGLRPERIALQPDGQYLWVAGGGAGERFADSGVTVLDTSTLDVAARIRTGSGRHDITFSSDSRFAFVTNSQQDTVSIIDVRTLKKRRDLPTGKTPNSIDFSRTGQVAYVTHSGDGTIAVVSGEEARVTRRVQAEKGLGQIRFSPGGRLGFIVNPEKNLVHILDAASSRIVQSGPVESGPDQIAFSDRLAYLRHQGSPNVLMIPLDAVGVEGKQIPLVDFPGGQNPPGRMSRPCWATSMVQAPGALAMLVSNAIDQAVYYYKEGMAAPMGTFKTYSCEPLAVMVVDRSLHDRIDAGCYETVSKLPRPDSYDVIFFLDTPRIMCSFPVVVQPNPELVRQRNEGKVDIKHMVDDTTSAVGKVTRLGFKLTDRSSGNVKSGLADVMIQTLLVPTTFERHRAKEIEPGVYAIELTPTEAGIYYVTVASNSIGLAHDNPSMLVLRVLPAGDSVEARRMTMPSKRTEGMPLATRVINPESESPKSGERMRTERIRQILGLGMLLAGFAPGVGCDHSPSPILSAAADTTGVSIPTPSDTLPQVDSSSDPQRVCCDKADVPGDASGAQPGTKVEQLSGGVSIPDVSLVNQDGQSVRFRSDLIKGKIVAVNFIFTSCKAICPPMSANFAKLQERLGDRVGNGVELISVSVDPQIDTPQRLHEWRKNFGAGRGWTLVTGKKQVVDLLLKEMEVFAADKNNHSPFILLGDEGAGKWIRVHGLTAPERLAEMIAGMHDALCAAAKGATIAPNESPTKGAASHMPVGAAEVSRAEKYFTNIELVSQHGERLRFDEDLLKGKVVVINSFFSTCKGSCPVMLSSFSRIQEHFADRVGKDLSLISISVDPQTDTPQVLAARRPVESQVRLAVSDR